MNDKINKNKLKKRQKKKKKRERTCLHYSYDQFKQVISPCC